MFLHECVHAYGEVHAEICDYHLSLTGITCQRTLNSCVCVSKVSLVISCWLFQFPTSVQ